MDNQYEQMKNKFLTGLTTKCGSMSIEMMDRVLNLLDEAADGYVVVQQETSLTVLDNGVPEMVKTYIAIKEIEGRSPGTIKGKFYRLRSFFNIVMKPIDKITPNDIRMYLHKYQEAHKISNSTLDGIRMTICAFFHWATSEGYVEKDPSIVVKPIKYEKKQRQSLTQLELEYLRKACATKRDRAILEFFYSTGCRVGELANVKIDDVDFDRSTVSLFGKGSKYRTSYLNAKAKLALKEYLNSGERKSGNDYLFCSLKHSKKKLSKSAVEKIINIICNNAPEITKKVTPHILRHTTATHAVANGMPINEVQKLLGHSSVATTMIYVEILDSAIKASHLRAVI